MSNDIKVGDVCEVVRYCCETSRKLFFGTECTVIPATCCQGVAVQCYACGAVFHDHVTIAHPAFSGVTNLHIPRHFLRKKPPKADDAEWIRQETVPRERFDQWLDAVRKGARIEETARV